MRVVPIAVSSATLAIVLVVGLGGVEAAYFPGDSLTNSGVPTVGVRYHRRHPSYYYRRGGRSVVHLPSLLQPRRDS